MAEISMKRTHGFEEPDEVRSRIEGLSEKVADRLGGTWCWEGDEVVCRSRGAVARVAYDEKDISIDVSLPLMLRPLRGKLEQKIEEYFGRYFDKG